MNSIENELKSLDLDLREIYNEFGTSEIYLKKHMINHEVDIYGYAKDMLYSEPMKLIGRVQVLHGTELNSPVGGVEDSATYTFHIIKSELKKYGINEITSDDIILYQDLELNITTATPVTILGDFALQYKIEATGKAFVSPSFGS